MNIQTNLILFGKHPCSSEYLSFGKNTDFSKSISNWMQNGYETFLEQNSGDNPSTCSHFCLLNEQKRSFACGSIKINSDLKNRAYPLMILLEVFPNSKFPLFSDVLNYCKNIWENISKILHKRCNMQELKADLAKLVKMKFDKINKTENFSIQCSIKEDEADNSCIVSSSSEVNFKNICKNLPSKKELSMFVDEKYNNMKIYYRSLLTDDFVTLVRL